MPKPKADSRPICPARLLGIQRVEDHSGPQLIENLEEIKVVTYLLQEFDLVTLTDSINLIELSLDDFYFTILNNINLSWFPLNQYWCDSIEHLDHDWLPDPIPIELFGNDPEDDYSFTELRHLFFVLIEWNKHNRAEFKNIYPGWPLPPDNFNMEASLLRLQRKPLPRPLQSMGLLAQWINSSTGNYFLDNGHSYYYYSWALSWKIKHLKALRAEWAKAAPLLAQLEELEAYAHEDNLRAIYDLIIGAT